LRDLHTLLQLPLLRMSCFVNDAAPPSTQTLSLHAALPILWCSVALDNGRKYHSNAKSYYTEVRARSDALCRKYGLSIIETKESEQSSMPYHVWLDEQENRPNWTYMVRQDVNEAISQALTWRQFLV